MEKKTQMSPLRRLFQIAGFASGIILMCGMGTNFAFSAYAPKLKENLEFTQTELNMIPSVGGIIAYFLSLGIGALHDWAGAPFVVFLSSIIMFAGYFLMLLANEYVFPAPWYIMAIFFAFTTTAQTGGYISSLSTVSKNFDPKYKGKIVGFLLMAYGLSAAIVTQIYKSFFYPSVTRFFFFLSVFIPALAVPAIIFMRQIPKEKPKEDNKDEEQPGGAESDDDSARLLHDYDDLNARDESQVSQMSDDSQPQQDDDDPDNDEEPAPILQAPTEKCLYPEYSGLFLAKHLDFWLLGGILTLGAGAGLMMINNLGSIAVSWQTKFIDYPTYVVVMSISNAAGRMLYGILADIFASRFPAVYLFGICCVCIAIAHSMLALTQNYITLMIGTILNGLSYGGSFAISPYVLSSYYGAERFGFHLSLVNLFARVSGLIFSRISGEFYDRFAQSRTPSGEPRCFGVWCWSITFAISAGSAIISCWFVVWLGIRESRAKAARESRLQPKQIQ